MAHFFAGIIASLAAVGSLLIPSSTTVIVPAGAQTAQTAVIAVTVAPPIATPSSIIGATGEPDIPPGLLPKVKKIKFKITQIAAANGSSTVIVAASSTTAKTPKPTTAPSPAPTAKPSVLSTLLSILSGAPAPSSTATPSPSASTPASTEPVTAQSLLAQTQTSFKETRDGYYELMLASNAGEQTVSWDLTQTQIGGTGTVPQFDFSYSCDPLPNFPPAASPDQSPLFNVGRSYGCTLTLTPTSGADLRAISKDVSFTTPPGELLISPASSINIVLVNGTNSGGIVFNNTDGAPVTITGLTFNVSYANIATVNGPLVLRFLDPATDQPLADHHLENIPADPSAQFTYSETGATTQLSFTIPTSTQKMLPLEVLGVDKMLVSGTTPSITVTLTGVATNRSEIKPILNSATITWKCVVAITGYDPNATSGPYATGLACTN